MSAPGKYMRGGIDMLAEHCLEGVRPDFAGAVRPGDIVITSGLDGVHPKGLRVGTVTEVEPPGSKLLRTATLAPAVDFGRLEQVFVMLRRGPTLELLYTTDSGDDAHPPHTAAAGP